MKVINVNTAKIWTASKELVIDETMVKCAKNHRLVTFMPRKPIKMGFKIYALHDAKHLILLDMLLDPLDIKSENIEYKFFERIVLFLSKPFRFK